MVLKVPEPASSSQRDNSQHTEAVLFRIPRNDNGESPIYIDRDVIAHIPTSLGFSVVTPEFRYQSC